MAGGSRTREVAVNGGQWLAGAAEERATAELHGSVLSRVWMPATQRKSRLKVRWHGKGELLQLRRRIRKGSERWP
jgi:hypothetical protein